MCIVLPVSLYGRNANQMQIGKKYVVLEVAVCASNAV